jgi:hypothetical protein
MNTQVGVGECHYALRTITGPSVITMSSVFLVLCPNFNLLCPRSDTVVFQECFSQCVFFSLNELMKTESEALVPLRYKRHGMTRMVTLRY